MTPISQIYRGRRVFLTGHTGFKGAWLGLWLGRMDAEITGFSREIPTEPSAFGLMALANDLSDGRGEIADREAVLTAMRAARPSIVFHLAAQPIVRAGFRDPYGTFRANVMGTAAVLEAARSVPSVEAVVVVTSDKVYDNAGSPWAFRETDPLGGHEPYGASKAAAEIVAQVYRSNAFLAAAGSAARPLVVTARAGNVIGGGDWAADRLIPDFVRALAEGRVQEIRSPNATRPWQHVLEPLGGYLLYGAALLQGRDLPGSLNFGPAERDMPTVLDVARRFMGAMGAGDDRVAIAEQPESAEAPTLRVDSSLAARALGWTATWGADRALEETAAWYRAHLDGGAGLRGLGLEQLARYRAETPVAALR